MLAPAIALASLVWLALLIVTPFAPSSFAAVMYTVAGVACHQNPERSFHLAGFQIPVCARCLGVYAGAAAVASIHGLRFLAAAGASWRVLTARAARRVFMIAALPTLATVALEQVGLWSGTNIVRSIAGVALGVGGALVVMSAVATLHYSECQRRRPIGPSRIPPPI